METRDVAAHCRLPLKLKIKRWKIEISPHRELVVAENKVGDKAVRLTREEDIILKGVPYRTTQLQELFRRMRNE